MAMYTRQMAAQSVDKIPCIFCGHPSSRRGEHVIPQGVLKRLFPPFDGPYTTYIGANEVRKDIDFSRAKVPCCDNSGHGCNDKLNRRFEEPFQDLVKRFGADAYRARPGHQEVAISAADRRGLGLWFLKTTLLFAHPERRDWCSHVNFDFKSLRYAPPTAWRWMVDDSSEPEDIHLWVTTSKWIETDEATFAPLVMWRDPLLGCVQQRIVDFGLGGLYFTLLFHPGAWIDRQPNAGVQLWPPLEGDVTWADLAERSERLDSNSRASTNRLIFRDDSDPKMEPFPLPFALADHEWCVGLAEESTY